MSDAKHGGQAFPQPVSIHRVPLRQQGDPEYLIASAAGMSLRDYFAASALRGLLANPDIERIAATGAPLNRGAAIASLAYQGADAMLAERAKGAA